MDRDSALAFARSWADAWNRRDLEAVLLHFADDAAFSSPRALEAVGAPTVRGRGDLLRYWQKALARVQRLEFSVRRVLWDPESRELAIVYDRELDGHRDRAVEILLLGAGDRIDRGEVLYGVIPTSGGVLARFAEYAAAFERSYADDDWARLQPYFAPDARYQVEGGPPLGGAWQGRAQLLDQLHASVNALDRRFDERRIELLGPPRSGPDWIEADWRSTYRKAGLPDLVFSGRERAEFCDERILVLADRLEPGADARIRDYLARYLSS
jgi:hypothetical protein